jgi:hypothetical protein
MKKSTFFKRAPILTATMSLLLAQSAYAGIIGVRTYNSSSGGVASGQTNSNVKVTSGKPVDENVEIKEGTALIPCKQDPDASTYFPLDFFQHITRDGSSIQFEQRADNKVLIKMPASIDVCGKFKPQLFQEPATKNVTVMMQLDNGKTYSEFVKCLSEAKIDAEGKNGTVLADGKIDHDKIPGKFYSEYSYVLDYSFEKDKDIKKTLKLSYGYPRAFAGKDGYPSAYGLDKSVNLPSALCMSAEMVQAKDPFYLNKGQDVMIEELKAICKTGDAQKIAEARKSIGNADALKDIADKIKSELDAGYLAAVKADVERISKEMTSIEGRFVAEKNTMDEATAKKLSAKYATLAKELDSKFMNPAIARLDTLLKQRSKIEDIDDPRIKTIDEEVKKLNEDIGAFNKRDAARTQSMFTVMEKFALTDSAKTINEIRLKSFLYGKVYAGKEDSRKKPISFEEANKQQVAGVEKYDKVMGDWTDQYLVSKGDKAPIQKTERERTAVIDRMNKRYYEYQKTETENYQKYCAVGFTGGVKNPVQCQAFMGGVEQRRNSELKRREKDLLYIKGRNDKLTRMGTSYNDYTKREVASATSDSFDAYGSGSSFASYDDNFNDLHPEYAGPQMSTAYNPNMYSMGAQQASQNMGQFGMFNPQMVNPQAQVMPGQFQMQGQGQGQFQMPNLPRF